MWFVRLLIGWLAGISEADIGYATDFLVNLGDIAACPENALGGRDLVVLDSQWLTKVRVDELFAFWM